MTALRLIPYPLHGAIELLTGLVLLAAPFALGFDIPGAAISVSIGALIVGLALSAATTEPRSRSLPVATHRELDHGLALGLLVAAVAVAVSGDAAAGIVLLAVAVVQITLHGMTRYSLRG